MSSSSRADSDWDSQLAQIKQLWRELVSRYSAWLRVSVVTLVLVLVLALPFTLRPGDQELEAPPEQTLVILSPHNDTIRNEIGRAFAEHMRVSEGKRVSIDWRNFGGTSEISKFIRASYQSAFHLYWRRDLGKRWSGRGSPGDAVLQRMVPDETSSDDSSLEAARRAFLESDVGIGVDLFFGGGAVDYIRHASYGHFVRSGIFEREPAWFSAEIIPATFSGERLYDPEKRWVGTCLSSFGICYNTDWIERLGIDPPTQWEDLGDARYLDTLALADPAKSGSATKAFEMLLQQQLAREVAKVDVEGAVDPDPLIDDALDRGWTAGLNLIQRISANARYFTDSAAKIPFDVAQGNAAAGMSIDFYGRTANEAVRQPDGSSRVQFVIPEAGTSVGADPIAMLRGAPHPELALDFIHFLLSPEGQRIWHYRASTPDGPTENALRRMPIRRDAYTPAEMQYSADPGLNPYLQSRNFHYRPEWTGPHFNVIRFIIQVMCLEVHDELQEAWTALAAADFPPRASRIFFDVQFVGYTNVTHELTPKLRTDDALAIQKRRRDLRESFRKNYRLATKLAKRGE